MISNKKTSKEIAESLSISHRTVEKHRANIIAKLNLISGNDTLFIWTQEHKELITNL
jgi:DNA-binding CsgD family transcriptional regulator